MDRYTVSRDEGSAAHDMRYVRVKYLLADILSLQRSGDGSVDVGDGLLDALALVCTATVPQLHSLVDARRGARGHGGAHEGSIRGGQIDLHRGIPAGVDDLSGVNASDGGELACSGLKGTSEVKWTIRLKHAIGNN